MGCYEARRRDSSRVKLKFYVGWNCQSPLYVSPSPGILSPQTGIRQFVANISIHSIPTGFFLFLVKKIKQGFLCDFFWISLTQYPIIAPLHGSHGLSGQIAQFSIFLCVFVTVLIINQRNYGELSNIVSFPLP